MLLLEALTQAAASTVDTRWSPLVISLSNAKKYCTSSNSCRSFAKKCFRLFVPTTAHDELSCALLWSFAAFFAPCGVFCDTSKKTYLSQRDCDLTRLSKHHCHLFVPFLAYNAPFLATASFKLIFTNFAKDHFTVFRNSNSVRTAARFFDAASVSNFYLPNPFFQSPNFIFSTPRFRGIVYLYNTLFTSDLYRLIRFMDVFIVLQRLCDISAFA